MSKVESIDEPLLKAARRFVKSKKLPFGGYVVSKRGVAFGWDQELCLPHEVEPGVVAVCVTGGKQFVATGGCDMYGAARWVSAAKEAIDESQ